MREGIKKLLVIMLAVTMLLSFLSACASQNSASTTNNADTTTNDTAENQANNEPEDTQEPADTADTNDSQDAAGGEKVTVTLLMPNTENRDGLNAVIEKMEKDLNIATEVELRPGGAEGENILRTRLAVGESTDIHLFNSGALLGTLNPAKNFRELNDQPYIDKFDEAYKQTVTFDGKIYGIPSSGTNAGGWLYNKKAYEELGLSIPKTWDELMENCEKIKAAGKTAVIGSFANDWTSQLILLADYYNVQAEEPDFAEKFDRNEAKYHNTPAAFKAFEKMAEVYEKGFLNEDYNATTLEQALKMLVDGDGIHYPMLTNQIQNIETNHGREAADNIGFFPQPGDDPDNVGVTIWIPNSFIFYKESPNIDACLKWAEYYVSDEAVELYASVISPTGPYVIRGPQLPDNVYPAIKDMLQYFEAGKTAPALEFITSVKAPNSPQICIQALGGLKSPEECAKEYDDDVEKQAKQLGLEGW